MIPDCMGSATGAEEDAAETGTGAAARVFGRRDFAYTPTSLTTSSSVGGVGCP
jgi:hypothetical protein